MRNDKKERREYYGRQRTLGLMIGLMGIVISLLVFDPCGLIVTAFGVWIYLTDEMVLVDEYYWTYMEELERKERLRKRRRRSK